MLKPIVKKLIALPLSVLPAPQHPQYDRLGLNLGWRIGWIRGWAIRPGIALRARLGRGPKVVFGKRFCLTGRMVVRGPGTIIIGNDVIVADLCTPFTHGSGAVIQIGDRTFLNGTRFGCSRRIEVGSDCIVADVRIMDTDFHAVHKRRNEAGMVPLESPVRIGNNVWIAAGSAILKGVVIGDNSLIAFGSVVTGEVPSNRIFGGNPARELGVVPEGPTALLK